MQVNLLMHCTNHNLFHVTPNQTQHKYQQKLGNQVPEQEESVELNSGYRQSTDNNQFIGKKIPNESDMNPYSVFAKKPTFLFEQDEQLAQINKLLNSEVDPINSFTAVKKELDMIKDQQIQNDQGLQFLMNQLSHMENMLLEIQDKFDQKFDQEFDQKKRQQEESDKRLAKIKEQIDETGQNHQMQTQEIFLGMDQLTKNAEVMRSDLAVMKNLIDQLNLQTQENKTLQDRKIDLLLKALEKINSQRK